MSSETPARRLVVVMAHPDDAEIEVGGTLFHLKAQGWEVGIITMTAGDCGSTSLRSDEIARTRHREAQAAADFLGASYSCAGFMDVEVFTNAENMRKVVEVLRLMEPDVIVTHSPVDYMLDHEETSRLVRGAAFAVTIPNYQTRNGVPAKISRTKPALYYCDPQEGIDIFGKPVYPQFYVDISAQLSKKSEMLAFHASQREWLRAQHGMDEYLDQVTDWASKCGGQCGFRYAEGLRQHLGHGYPKEPVLQQALAPYVCEGQNAEDRIAR
jgi:LmbE family N-acetylglucosaminyl deacetylase